MAHDLDEELWSRMGEIICAAHEADRERYWSLLRSFDAEFDLRRVQRAGLYLWVLLRAALAGKIGGRVPSDVDLSRISRENFARFRILADVDQSILEDLFRKAFERPPLRKKISPGELLVLAPAALGVLYGDPDSELKAVKPRIVEWWKKYAEDFYREGLIRLVVGMGCCSTCLRDGADLHVLLLLFLSRDCAAAQRGA